MFVQLAPWAVAAELHWLTEPVRAMRRLLPSAPEALPLTPCSCRSGRAQSKCLVRGAGRGQGCTDESVASQGGYSTETQSQGGRALLGNECWFVQCLGNWARSRHLQTIEARTGRAPKGACESQSTGHQRRHWWLEGYTFACRCTIGAPNCRARQGRSHKLVV